tara:strand:+ start:384 stop:557 length:174 start_codon:yes stop_codon:yes gene_type:complete
LIVKFIGQKINKKCDMCKESKVKGDYYLWRGIITHTECEVCTKCAKREGMSGIERES